MKKALLWIGIVLVGLPVVALLLLSTPPATRFVVGKLLPKINAQLNGTLTYRSVSGSLLRGLELRGVVLRDPEGEVVLQAERVGVAYSLWDILHSRFDIGPLELDKPVVRLLKRTPGEPYSLVRVFTTEDTGGAQNKPSHMQVRIHDIRLREGAVFATVWHTTGAQREEPQSPDTVQLADIRNLTADAAMHGDSLSLSIGALDLPQSHLSLEAWRVGERFNATAKVNELVAADLAGVVEGAEIPADWRVQGTIHASSRMATSYVISSPDLRIAAAGGTMHGRLTLVGADNEWTAQNSRIEVSRINVERLLRAFHIPSDLRATIDGVITADGRAGDVALQVHGLGGYGVKGTVNGYVNASGGFDALSFDTRLAGGVGTVAFSGQAMMGKHLRLDRIRGTLQQVNLAAVDARMPESRLNARLEADVVFGSMPREGHLRLFVDSSTIRGIQVDTAAVIATAHEGLLTVDSLLVRAPGLQAKGTGTFGLTEDQTGDLTLTLDAPSLGEVEPLLASVTHDSVFDIAGALQARVRAQGSLSHYTLDLEAHGKDIAVQGFEIESFTATAQGPPDSLHFGADVKLDSITRIIVAGHPTAVDSLSIERGEATWRLEDGSRIERRNGAMAFENAVLRRSPAGGAITVQGTYPTNLTLTIEQLPMVDIVPAAKTDSLPDLNGKVELAGGVWNGKVGLALEGREPLAVEFTSKPLHGRLTADSFDLATIAPLVSALRNLGGRLDGGVEVTGSMDAPRLTGRLQLVDATASVPATGVRYGDIDASLVFSGDALTLETVKVAAGKGTAELTGRVRFARLDRPELDIKTTIQRFPVMNRRDFIQATASGEMTLAGSAAGARLAGRVTVDQGTAFLDKFLRASGIDLADPLYAQFIDTTVLRREALSPGLIQAFIDTLHIDNLSVDLGENFWLRSPDASIQLGGSVAVSSAKHTDNVDKYDLIGTVRAVRGIYRMAFAPGLTREFMIREGSIRYYGSPKTDASLDLAAEHVVRTATGDRVTITAHIGGTLAAPTIGLTSDVTPALSETEIISYLVFGAPTVQAFLGHEGQTSEKRSVFEQSAGQLVGVLSGKIESAVIGGLGLPIDYFRIKPGEVQNGLAGTELVLGMQVHILGFPSFLRASPRFCPREQLLSLDHIGIDLETRIAPQWGVTTSVDPLQGCESVMSGTSARPYQLGVDLFWEKR